jgi:predicted Zn-dependent peptidase
MLNINLTKKALEVQQKVVIEEFNQRYLNQPYGNVSLLLRPLAYKVHPYQWSTIGKDISHIANATKEDVEVFYSTFYNPQNAVLVLAGNIDELEAIALTEKWFNPIQKDHAFIRNIPKEPEQKEARRLEVVEDVPLHHIIISFPMCSRLHTDYPVFDLLTDVLSDGGSSRLYQTLVKKQQIFNTLGAHISGSLDEGQVIFSGYVLPNVPIELAEKALWEEIHNISTMDITDSEMTKLLNKNESSQAFQQVSVMEKAMNLAYYDMLGDVNMINTEKQNYLSVTKSDIKRCAAETFLADKSSTLLYLSKSLTSTI